MKHTANAQNRLHTHIHAASFNIGVCSVRQARRFRDLRLRHSNALANSKQSVSNFACI